MTLLPPSTTTPGAARRFVRHALESASADEELIDTAELLTSELVTNVVLHTCCGGMLVIVALGTGVRVEVSDREHGLDGGGPDGAGRGAAPAPGEGTSGRGLPIVAALADTWGVRPIPDDGKIIWFELRPTG